MPLQRLTLTPGVNKDATPTAGKGGWYDTEKVRFRNGMPEKIGGWSPLTQFRVIGVPRALIGWVGLEGTNALGIGTNEKYYVEIGGTLEDITPIRKSVTLGSDISTVNGSNVITIQVTGHGANTGDYVEI